MLGEAPGPADGHGRSAGVTRREFLAGVAVFGAAALAGCGRGGVPTVRLAAGEVGGFYHAFTQLLAAAAAEAGTVRIEPVTTGGSLANLELLARGHADAALALADSVALVGGQLTAIGRVYENYLQMAVRADGPITTVAGLRGARISVGAPGSGATHTGERLLRAAGLDPGIDVAVTHLALRDAVAAIADGSADALLWAGGVPTGVLDVPRTLRLIDLGGLAQPMRDRFGYLYDRVVIPADTYPHSPAVPTIGVANLLVTTPALPADTADALTDLLLTRADDLVPDAAAGTQFLDARSLISTNNIPLHPGAARVYRRYHG
ncbi:TAXI family TRAP transporter solute-binding subunit [Nocardia transvalensis]|uniref:TAXI family TRAP transporter solute-binding subunit n=1 Tax=Nocardia transvalensis TaxID=37333 RepID=UPI0018947D23|nr:TAXI family TRAP transporter solute-binding subunit [Nocardia transvalensis]MBF6328403.1 TAXI family TRAP transporter solute-binding subunit [Nocardia transvalensis]